MTSTTTPAGSAERWGPLWGARPADWALSEDQQLPTYEEAIRRVGLAPGSACSTSAAGPASSSAPSPIAAPHVDGIDASEALIDARPHARAGRRPPRRRDGGPAVRGRRLRPRHRLQLVLLRRRHGRRAARGRPRRQARRAGRDPGLGRARALRPRGDEADREAVLPARRSRRATAARSLASPACSRGSRRRGGARAEDDVRRLLAVRLPRRATSSRAACSPRPASATRPGSGRTRSRRVDRRRSRPSARADGSYSLENEWHFLVAAA